MSSEQIIVFKKDDLERYIKELAKEYRRLIGKKMPAEIILIGGASVLINYGFREMTMDVDAVIMAASSMKDAIMNVGERFGLPTGWINDDFRRTASYSPRLAEKSTYYKTYYGVLTVRTISAEYLVAMKLRAGRQYKHDLSDIIGILAEHASKGHPLTLGAIKKAYEELYGDWETLSAESRGFIESALSNGNYEEMLSGIAADERATREALIEFSQKYPGTANASNIDDIISELRKRRTQ